jgi:hypothetical protein
MKSTEIPTVWIPDSKTPSGIAEVSLTEIAPMLFAVRCDFRPRPSPVPERREFRRLSEDLQTVWHPTLRRAGVRYFRMYDFRSTCATRLSAGGVADEWVTQLLRQGEAKVFKKYSQMKREALATILGFQRMSRFANVDRTEGGAQEIDESILN